MKAIERKDRRFGRWDWEGGRGHTWECVGGQSTTTKWISPLFVRRLDLKSGPLYAYVGGPKVGPLQSQFFHFFIVEIRAGALTCHIRRRSKCTSRVEANATTPEQRTQQSTTPPPPGRKVKEATSLWHPGPRLNRINKNTHTNKLQLLFWKPITKNSKVKRAWLGAMGDRPRSPSRVRMSEDKVC
jgi:hypothetical protein